MKELDLTNSKDLGLVLSIEQLTGVILRAIARRNNKKKALKLRELCVDHYYQGGHHVALFEIKLNDGTPVRWIENVDGDPYGLYKW